jgi:hypothetical protein
MAEAVPEASITLAYGIMWLLHCHKIKAIYSPNSKPKVAIPLETGRFGLLKIR